MATVQAFMECPTCHRTSWHPQDVEYGFCAACASFTRGSLIFGSQPPVRWCASMCGHVVPAAAPDGGCESCRLLGSRSTDSEPQGYRPTRTGGAAIGCALLVCVWGAVILLAWLLAGVAQNAFG